MAPAPAKPGDAVAELAPQVTNLDLVLGPGEALFRVMALLHRKHVTIEAARWHPGDRCRQGRRLRLAINCRHAPSGHVITLLHQVIGVLGVRVYDAETHRPLPGGPRPHESPPTRYVAWSQPICQTPAKHQLNRWSSSSSRGSLQPRAPGQDDGAGG